MKWVCSFHIRAFYSKVTIHGHTAIVFHIHSLCLYACILIVGNPDKIFSPAMAGSHTKVRTRHMRSTYIEVLMSRMYANVYEPEVLIFNYSYEDLSSMTLVLDTVIS